MLFPLATAHAMQVGCNCELSGHIETWKAGKMPSVDVDTPAFPYVPAGGSCTDGYVIRETGPNGEPEYRWSRHGQSTHVDMGWIALTDMTLGGFSQNLDQVGFEPHEHGIPRGSRLNYNLAFPPSPGDFMNPAPTLGASSFALLPSGDADLSTAWNGVSRPTLHGKLDMVTGLPLAKVTDLELPFGSTTFRLSRTRSGIPNLGSNEEERSDGISHVNMQTDAWWDWAGVGWMVSENPFFLVDSATADAVGVGPRTCWFMPDAHHSIPFQQIVSTGHYEAPPRFRATLSFDDDAVWNATTQAWDTPPAWYKVHLYEGRLTYTFVVVREDVPTISYDPDLAIVGHDTDPANNRTLSSAHERPFMRSQFNDLGIPYDENDGDLRGEWNNNIGKMNWQLTGANPADPCEIEVVNSNDQIGNGNPGLGIPYYGLCVAIEDQHGHRVEIDYYRLEHHHQNKSGSSCHQCWEATQAKGQIRTVRLNVEDSNEPDGWKTEWTLLYTHRRFKYGIERPDNSIEIEDLLTDREIAEKLPSGDVPAESAAETDLWSLRGMSAIDRIYVFEGDPVFPVASDEDLDPYLVAPHTERFLDASGDPDLDAGDDLLDTSGLTFPDWEYRIRYHYDIYLDDHSEHRVHTGDDPWPGIDTKGWTGPLPWLIKTTVEDGPGSVIDRRVFHYRHQRGYTMAASEAHPAGWQDTHATSSIWASSPRGYLEAIFENDDIARILNDDELWDLIDTGNFGFLEATSVPDLANELALWTNGSGEEFLQWPGGVVLSDDPRVQALLHASVWYMPTMWNLCGGGCSGLPFAANNGHFPSFAELSSGGFLLNSEQNLYHRGTFYADRTTAAVDVIVLRDHAGNSRVYRTMPLGIWPQPRQGSISGFNLGWIQDFVSDGRSKFLHPYRWRAGRTAGYPWAGAEHREHSGGNNSNDRADDATAQQPADLSAVRWIALHEEYESIDDAHPDNHVYYGGISGQEPTMRPGLLSRQIVEMNPAGHVLRDRSWFFTEDGTLHKGSGLGEEYVFDKVENRVPGYPAAPPGNGPPSPVTPGGTLAWNDIVSGGQIQPGVIRDEGVLVEKRSVGWSAGKYLTDGTIDATRLSDGYVEFYEYALYGDSQDPLRERVQLSAEGIKRGQAYQRTWEAPGGAITTESNLTNGHWSPPPLAGGAQYKFSLTDNTNGGPRLYRKKYFRDEDNPTQLSTEVGVLSPVTNIDTALPSEPDAGDTTISASTFVFASAIEEYDPNDDERMQSRVVVSPGRPIGPAGTLYYPVTWEWYTEQGQVQWSADAFLSQAAFSNGGVTPSASSSDQFCSVILTYHHLDDKGRAIDTVEDAVPGQNVTRQSDGSSLAVPAVPDSDWSRFGTPALERITSRVFDRKLGVVDVWDPTGRRWSKRATRYFDADGTRITRIYEFADLKAVAGGYINDAPTKIEEQYLAAPTEENDWTAPSLPKFTATVTLSNTDLGNPGTINVDAVNLPYGQESDLPGPNDWEIYRKRSLVLDPTGRLSVNVEESDASGTLQDLGSAEVNDLGEVVREEAIDGVVKRTTRNAIGQTRRVYEGTDDPDWVYNNPGDLVLKERTAYGAGINDARLSTGMWTYRAKPSWHDQYYDEAAADASPAGYFTSTAYDWRMRPVRVEKFAGEDDQTTRLMTTLTYYDHADRVVMVAEFGEGALTLPVGSDPVDLVDNDPNPDPEELFSATGAPLLALSTTAYDNQDHVIERRDYDVSWTYASGVDAPHLAERDYAGRGGVSVYTESPDSGLMVSVQDGLGRVTSEINAIENGIYLQWELSRTDFTYDVNGNVIETRRFTRTEDTGEVLVADGGSPNAVRSRTVTWYDNKNRVLAEADLGTEQSIFGPGAEVYAREATPPSYNEGTMVVSRGNLPDKARLSINVYEEGTGFKVYSVDPAGVATQYVYSKAGRLEKTIEGIAPLPLGAPAVAVARQRITQTGYHLGRVVELSTPRRGELTTTEQDQVTRVLYTADVVEEGTYDKQSTSFSLVGKMWLIEDPAQDLSTIPLDQDLEDSGSLGLTPDITLTYFFDGRIAERRDKRGVSFRYAYDALGRLTSVSVGHEDSGWNAGYPASMDLPGSVAPSGRVSKVLYAYNAEGRLELVTAKDEADSVLAENRMEYNDRGDLTKEWQAIEASVVLASTPAIEYEWAYDAATLTSAGSSRLALMKLPAFDIDIAGTTRTVQRAAELGYGTPDDADDELSRITDLSSRLLIDGSAGGMFTHSMSIGRAGDGRRIVTSRAAGMIEQSYADPTLSGTQDASLPGLDRFGMPINLHYAYDDGTSVLSMYRSLQAYDERGNRAWTNVRQASVGGSSRNNVRSTISDYDTLGRLHQHDIGDIGFAVTYDLMGGGPVGDPVPFIAGLTGLVRSDVWHMDALGNWTGTESAYDLNGDDFVDSSDLVLFMELLSSDPEPWMDLDEDGEYTIDDVIAWLALQEQEYAGRRTVGNLDYYGSVGHPQQPGADAATDIDRQNHKIDRTNALEGLSERDGDANATTVTSELHHDAIGNLIFDGEHLYSYDAWNRIIEIHEATYHSSWNANLVFDPQAHLVLGDLVRRYGFDGFGRLVQTTSPDTAGTGTYTERYHHDGLRRVQTVEINPSTSDRTLQREYVWGPGDNGFDEPVMVFEGHEHADREPAWWPIVDSSGDVVALCDVNGSAPRVAAQWTYEPYGQVITAESIHSHPALRMAHKGLFVDRLDLATLQASSGVEPAMLMPLSKPILHNRNRTVDVSRGRFFQRDPNQTGQIVSVLASHGSYMGVAEPLMSVQGLYGDGHSLYGYLGASPIKRSDPSGLFMMLSISASTNARIQAGGQAFLAAHGAASFVQGIIQATQGQQSWLWVAADAVTLGKGKQLDTALDGYSQVSSAVRNGTRVTAAATKHTLPSALRGGDAVNHVYYGYKNGKVVYVGITNDIVRRAAEHGDRFRIRAINSTPLTRGEARAIEQAAIVRNSQFENVRNSISPSHNYYDEAVEWGEQWLRQNGH